MEQIWLNILFILGICVGSYQLYTGIRYGRIYAKYVGDVNKDERPVLFWITFIFNLIFVVVLTFILIAYMIGFLP